MPFVLPIISVALCALCLLAMLTYVWDHNGKQAFSCAAFAIYTAAVAWVTWPY